MPSRAAKPIRRGTLTRDVARRQAVDTLRIGESEREQVIGAWDHHTAAARDAGRDGVRALRDHGIFKIAAHHHGGRPHLAQPAVGR